MSIEKPSVSIPDLQTKLLAEDLLKRSSSQPIYLSSVEVVGGDTFSTNFFKKLLSPLVDTKDYTFGQLVDNVEESYRKLENTDVFKNISVSLASDYMTTVPKLQDYNKEKTIPTKVKFQLDSINLNIGEYFLNLNSDDPFNFGLNYLNNNFNSNAELVNVGANYNPYKPNQHLITTGKFLANLNNPSFKFLIDIFNTTQNNQLWQQASEKSIGGLIGLQYRNQARSLHILTGLSFVRRTIHDIEDAATDELKFFAGDFLKSAIVNKLSYSSVDYLSNTTQNFPTNGFDLSLNSEISSVQEQNTPTNANFFIKSAISNNLYKSLWRNNFTFHLASSVGLIYNPNEDIPVHVSDRFYLGGADSFRGFSKNSIDTDGGNQFFKIDAKIYSKLPKFIYSLHVPNNAVGAPSKVQAENELNPLRLYVNGIIGNVTENLAEEETLCTSVGTGLRYFNDWANFDIGYYVGRRLNDSSDFGLKNGFQFAISIGGSNRTLPKGA